MITNSNNNIINTVQSMAYSYRRWYQLGLKYYLSLMILKELIIPVGINFKHGNKIELGTSVY